METKTCTKCKQIKSIENFNFHRKSLGTRYTKCKSCWNEENKLRYEKNKAYYIEKANRNKAIQLQKLFEKIREYLANHCCIDCGLKDIDVLQFDHVRGKKFLAVSEMISRGYSWEAILEEIQKCEIRCANCHHKKTAKQFNWRKSR